MTPDPQQRQISCIWASSHHWVIQWPVPFLYNETETWWESLSLLQKLKLSHKILLKHPYLSKMLNILLRLERSRKAIHANKMQSNIPELHPDPSTTIYNSTPVLSARSDLCRDQPNEKINEDVPSP